MKTKERIIWTAALAVSVVTSAYVFNHTGSSIGRAKKVYSLDVNEDGLDDLVVKSSDFSITMDIPHYDAFIASKDSEGNINYTPLSEVVAKAQDSAKVSLNEQKRTLGTRLQTMAQRVYSHKYGD